MIPVITRGSHGEGTSGLCTGASSIEKYIFTYYSTMMMLMGDDPGPVNFYEALFAIFVVLVSDKRVWCEQTVSTY